jgi:hypothetical protein
MLIEKWCIHLHESKQKLPEHPAIYQHSESDKAVITDESCDDD